MTDKPGFALLHGGGQGSWVWGATAALLEAKGGRVLALDVPGCGVKRGRDPTGIALDEVADELIGDIRDSGLSDLVLVGHSLAGAVLPVMAARWPFRRLVFLSCTLVPDGRSFLQQMGRGLHGANDEETGWPIDPGTSSLEDRYRAMFCNDMDDAMATAFLAKLGNDIWPMDVMTRTHWHLDHLADIPSTYLLCERDRSLPPAWQERFAERAHCDRIVRIDAGHQAMNTQPEKLAELLMAEAVA